MGTARGPTAGHTGHVRSGQVRSGQAGHTPGGQGTIRNGDESVGAVSVAL